MAPTKIKKKAAAKTKSSPAAKGGSSASKKQRASGKTNGLHLPSLTIKGFRGVKELELSELGRVTLLVGKNGVGKSTVLEAVRLYASFGNPEVIGDILTVRESVLEREDIDGDAINFPDHGGLFFGYDEPKSNANIEIGCTENGNALEIEISNFDHKELDDMPPPLLSVLEGEGRCFVVSSGPDRKRVGKFPFIGSGAKRKQPYQWMGGMSRFWSGKGIMIDSIPCERLGPDRPRNAEIVSWYEELALTKKADLVMKALYFVRPDIEGLISRGSIGHNYRSMRIGGYDRRMVTKLKGVDAQVPLRSMGDGIVHLLGLAVALINAKDGFLLIDEVENGIHYSLFPELWEFVFRTAEKNNVQVIATTHSWDCVAGFAKVSLELKEIRGQLFRIQREGEDVRAVSYTEEELAIAAKIGSEVR